MACKSDQRGQVMGWTSKKPLYYTQRKATVPWWAAPRKPTANLALARSRRACITLSWYMDETWRQDWTPFSITVLDLSAENDQLERSCENLGVLHYDTYSEFRGRRSIAYRSRLVLSLFESESATSRMLASSIFGLNTDIASIDVLAEAKKALHTKE